jgi:hypothetical protein
MHKKLTITLDERVYAGFHKAVGRGKISQFIEALVRRQVLDPDVEAGYREMASDQQRETEAEQWTSTRC